MKAIIVEDEPLAATRLKEMIEKANKGIEVQNVLHSVEQASAWLNSNPHPDVLFLDIQLGDGLSFEILENARPKCPVIFTTAFNEYAVKAFRVNSIDYLLKPIDASELSQAIDKLQSKNTPNNETLSASTIAEAMKMLTRSYKKQFVVKVGEHLRTFSTNQVSFFISMEKSTFATLPDGKSYAMDFSVDQIQELVDPQQFFRINRKCLANIEFINDIVSYSGSRLKLKIAHLDDDDALVSREKVNVFKEWLDR